MHLMEMCMLGRFRWLDAGGETQRDALAGFPGFGMANRVLPDVESQEIEACGEMADVSFGFGPAQPTWCEPLGQERLGLHGRCVRWTKDCHI